VSGLLDLYDASSNILSAKTEDISPYYLTACLERSKLSVGRADFNINK